MIKAGMVLATAVLGAPALAEDCRFLRDPVHICGSDHGWFEFGPFGRYGNDAFLTRVGGPNAYIVSDPLDGSDYTLATLEATALRGLPAGDPEARTVRVLERSVVSHLGMEWLTLVYERRTSEDVTLLFANTMALTETHAIQLITIEHEVDAYTDTHRADHALFVSAIALEP
ncbi:hypothetical protein [Gymnodinialimonas hymeniacidonis]|uniref:hypothetical protein n=1 Tax=Gymnodinialimonas hymeniacidonis TaxID=3126508 RepID=UPI0034C65292